jgi:hypothetical protein
MLPGSLEAYHSLVLKYASKRTHYKFASQLSRARLSVLDYNENNQRREREFGLTFYYSNEFVRTELAFFKSYPRKKTELSVCQSVCQCVCEAHNSKTMGPSGTVEVSVDSSSTRDVPFI